MSAFTGATLWLPFVAICIAYGQNDPVVRFEAASGADNASGPLAWASALRDRFNQMQDPVLVTYSLARLGALVCLHDKTAGTKLVVEALTGLKNLPADAFDKSLTPLAVSSFTALTRFAQQAAQPCEVATGTLDDAATRSRLAAEWLKANVWLNKALGMKDPNRAIQLADAAFSVSYHGNILRSKALKWGKEYDWRPGAATPGMVLVIPPETLDLSLYSRVLAKLKQTAPDLTDALFQRTLESVLSASPPTAAELGELGRYLFPAGSSIQLPVEPRWLISPPGGLPMPNFMLADLKGNFDLAVVFLDKAAQVVQNYETASADALDAYALAYQMLPKAREYAPDNIGSFQTALLAIEPKLGANAAKIRGDLGVAPASDPYGAPQSDFVLASKILSHLRVGRFGAARGGLSSLGDTALRRQLESLIAFEETAQSLPQKDAERILDRPIYPDAGSKRALLYAALVPASATHDGALRALQMAVKETESLSTAERLCVLPAIASAALPIDADQAVDLLRQLVKAHNEAAGNSPSENADAQSGSSAKELNVRCGETGLREYVDTKEGRQSFLLHVPSVSTYNLDAFLVQVKAAEISRLESALLGLHDETQMAKALLALAELGPQASSR